jgi:phosphomannomutase
MTSPPSLHISDSGWRAVIAEGFTVARFSAVVEALAEVLPKQKALLGFDNRFLSKEFGHHAAALLAEKGWAVDLIPEIFPTPGVAKLTRETPYDFGLVVTASHNPYYYNGFKILDSQGALIGRDLADRIETAANGILGGRTRSASVATLAKEAGSPLHFDIHRRFESVADVGELRRGYLDSIAARVDAESIRSAKLSVCWDAFGGTVTPLFPLLFDRLGVRHAGVPMVMEPTFGRRRLEPDATSLRELGVLVAKSGAVAGLATDVDGDRFSAVDQNGAYVQNNPLGSLMAWYLLALRGERGTVYQTVSCSDLTRRICGDFGVPLKIEPVGFMQMGRHMTEDQNPLIGFEETGGMAYGPHLPFKDGLMAHALVLEMLARTGRTIPELVADLGQRYGRFHYHRIDLKLPSQEEAERWLNPALWERAVGEAVLETSTMDGVKWIFKSGWILIRRSKTEPLLRIYGESADETFVDRMKKAAQ